MVEDFYRPWTRKTDRDYPDLHFVKAGRVGMVIAATALGSMAVLSYFWQQYSDMPLLSFALSVMVFAYSGLLGVYFNALFTQRGNATSAALALVVGFLTTLFFQPYIQDTLGTGIDLAFPYQLCVGSFLAFVICFLGRPAESSERS
jgi:Na+/proline symporter